MPKEDLIVQIQNEVGEINSVMPEVNRMAVFLKCEYNTMLLFKAYLYYTLSRIGRVLDTLERLEVEDPLSNNTKGNTHRLEVEIETLQGLLDLAKDQLQNEDLKEVEKQ